MLRMTKLADYATMVMAYLAQNPGKLCSALEISGNTGLELPTVSKLLKQLARSGLLLAKRGTCGGYMLMQPPREISLVDIIETIEGQPIGLTECSSVSALCCRESSCPVRANWQRISQEVYTILKRMTLAELIRPLARTEEVRIRRSKGEPSGEGSRLRG